MKRSVTNEQFSLCNWPHVFVLVNLLIFLQLLEKFVMQKLLQIEYLGGQKGMYILCHIFLIFILCTHTKQTFPFNRVGYVEFYDEESVPKALALTGQKLLGIP